MLHGQLFLTKAQRGSENNCSRDRIFHLQRLFKTDILKRIWLLKSVRPQFLEDPSTTFFTWWLTCQPPLTCINFKTSSQNWQREMKWKKKKRKKTSRQGLCNILTIMTVCLRHNWMASYSGRAPLPHLDKRELLLWLLFYSSSGFLKFVYRVLIRQHLQACLMSIHS